MASSFKFVGVLNRRREKIAMGNSELVELVGQGFDEGGLMNAIGLTLGELLSERVDHQLKMDDLIVERRRRLRGRGGCRRGVRRSFGRGPGYIACICDDLGLLLLKFNCAMEQF